MLCLVSLVFSGRFGLGLVRMCRMELVSGLLGVTMLVKIVSSIRIVS